jgi:hypothetical protein
MKGLTNISSKMILIGAGYKGNDCEDAMLCRIT